MIPHDATLIVWAIVEAGGEIDKTVLERQVSPQLRHSFSTAWEYLLDNEIVIRQFSSEGQLHAAGATVQRKSAEQLTQNTLISDLAQERWTVDKRLVAVDKVDPRSVRSLVAKTTDSRNFSAPYRAVVDGVKAKRDPIMEYVESLSPVDRPDFLNAFMGMTDAQQADLRAGAARSTDRGRRD
jgi:hypothetical protein